MPRFDHVDPTTGGRSCESGGDWIGDMTALIGVLVASATRINR